MKKTLSFFVLLLFLLSFPVSAVSGKLSAADVSGKAGDQVTVNVHLDNPGIIATRIFIRYDSSVLRLDGAENGEVFGKEYALFGKDIQANPYTMLWNDSLRTENIKTSGTLCTLKFTILKDAANGETNVRIAVDKSSTFDYELKEVTVVDGNCTIKTGGGTAAAAATTSTTAKTTTTTTAAAPKSGKAAPPAASTTTKAKPDKTVSAADAAKTSSAVGKSIPSAASKTESVVSGSSTRSSLLPAEQKSSATTTRPGETAAGKVAASSKSVTAEPAASSAASAANNSAPGKSDSTTAAASVQTIPDLAITRAVEVDGDVKTIERPTDVTEDLPSDTSEASEVLTTGSTEEKASRHVNLLWLLVLVPVAAFLVFLIIKKKK